MAEKLMVFLQNETFLLQGEMFLRIVIAALCGSLVGYERTNRGKGAGIRTHTIVALASCLMMIISQYGFSDFFENFNNENVKLSLDPSRVAAQIVSGIGFLGAGMIFIQKNVVTGLTTAAGIWAVAGVGMAIGSGMYFMGIACTVVIIVIQLIMHKSAKFTGSQGETEMSFLIEDNQESVDALVAQLKECKIGILEIEYNKKEEKLLEITILVQNDHNIDKVSLLDKLYSQGNIKSVKF